MNLRYQNYHLRFYDYDHKGSPLLLQVYIFDKTEVLIASQSPQGGALDTKLMSFKNKQLAEILTHYFEIVWRDALILKDAQTVDLNRLKKVAQRKGISIT